MSYEVSLTKYKKKSSVSQEVRDERE